MPSIRDTPPITGQVCCSTNSARLISFASAEFLIINASTCSAGRYWMHLFKMEYRRGSALEETPIHSLLVYRLSVVSFISL